MKQGTLPITRDSVLSIIWNSIYGVLKFAKLLVNRGNFKMPAKKEKLRSHFSCEIKAVLSDFL